MTWSKLTDEFLTDKAVVRLSDRAYRLFVSSIVYSSRELTDGEVDDVALRVLAGVLGFKPNRYVDELVHSGLWTNGDGVYRVKSYLDYNRDADTVREERRKAQDRMKRLRNGRRQK